MSGWVFLGWASTKLGLMRLAQGHNTVTLVRLEPVAPRSQVKHSTTEPLHSPSSKLIFITFVSVKQKRFKTDCVENVSNAHSPILHCEKFI